MTPLSGPSQRSCESPVRCLQNAPGLDVNAENSWPKTNGRRLFNRFAGDFIAATDRKGEAMTFVLAVIARQNNVSGRIVGIGIHRIGAVQRGEVGKHRSVTSRPVILPAELIISGAVLDVTRSPACGRRISERSMELSEMAAERRWQN